MPRPHSCTRPSYLAHSSSISQSPSHACIKTLTAALSRPRRFMLVLSLSLTIALTLALF
ncbi:hypothetical protein MA16_Dca028959 [Dendrobium catenatum]|uniref:Uncharacterized protein n=1 Tax=Dendrobium catenatum TaxID=906689 RepID=A0A2I0VDK3_9ASPA|nr:hypothetical protein MA16_Dca028959 [Dendrobium catenatum]